MRYRVEILASLMMHAGILALAAWAGIALELLIFWWLPYATTFAIIGWFSELSKHVPMMRQGNNQPVYASRNRYAAWYGRLIIGMHGDHYPLAHHPLPGIPHWNLGKAAKILREDKTFRAWDDVWGGIFSKTTPERVSFIGYMIDDHVFTIPDRRLAPNTEKTT